MPPGALASDSSPSPLGTAVGLGVSSCWFLGASKASGCFSVVVSLAPWGIPFDDGGGVHDLFRESSLLFLRRLFSILSFLIADTWWPLPFLLLLDLLLLPSS